MWGLVSPENEVTREEQNIDPNASTKPGWRWLSITELPSPIYDPKLQTLEGTNYNILESSIEKYWSVRDKTSEEIESDKQSKLGNISQIIIELLFEQENKIRQLQQQSLLTKDEFINYIKSIM